MERPRIETVAGLIVVRWPDNEIRLTPSQAMSLMADETLRSAIRFAVQRLRGQVTRKGEGKTHAGEFMPGGMEL